MSFRKDEIRFAGGDSVEPAIKQRFDNTMDNRLFASQLFDHVRRNWPEAAAGLCLYRARDQVYMDLTRVRDPRGLLS